MRKTILIIAAVLGFAVAAAAQPKSIGGRIGINLDVDYTHNLGNANFLEFGLGLDGYKNTNFHIDGIYNFMIAEPAWTSMGTWGFYGGPGASVAVWDTDNADNVVYAGVVGNLGLEYIFDFQLRLALDLRPRIMFGDGGFRNSDIIAFGLSVGYAF